MFRSLQALLLLFALTALPACQYTGQASDGTSRAEEQSAVPRPPAPSEGTIHESGRGPRTEPAARREPLFIPPAPGGEGAGNAGAAPSDVTGRDEGSFTAAGRRQPPASPPAQTSAAATFDSKGVLATRVRTVVADAVSRGVTRRVGVAVYDLATGEGIGLNAQQEFRPASVIKMAVLVSALQARSKMSPAQFERLRPDMERMITVSDNPATRRLVHRLGARRVNAAMRGLGFRRFRVGESGSRQWVLSGSKASPADTALLLARIARREVISPQACDEMLALLGAQEMRDRIPAGLPPAPDLWVGNKTGTVRGVVNDVGVVLQPDQGIGYTLAMFTSGTRTEKQGEQLLADLSAVIYAYMAARSRG